MAEDYSQGGTEGNAAGAAGSSLPATPPAEDKDRRSFTQAELDAMFAERARRAAEGATRELLTAVGVKTSDELKAMVTAAQDVQRAQMSELEKARADAQAALDKATRAEQERQQAIEKAQDRLLQAEVIAEARARGLSTEAASVVWKALDRETVKLDGEVFKGVDKAVEKVIAAIKSQAGSSSSSGSPARGDKKVGGARRDSGPRASSVRL